MQRPVGIRVVQPGPAEIAPPVASRTSLRGRGRVPAAQVMVARGHVTGNLKLLQQALSPAIPILTRKAFQLSFVEQVSGEKHEFRVDKVDVIYYGPKIVHGGGIAVEAAVWIVNPGGQMEVRDMDEVVAAFTCGNHFDGVGGGVVDPSGSRNPQIVKLINRQGGYQGLQFPAVRRVQKLAVDDFQSHGLVLVHQPGLPAGGGRRRNASDGEGFAGDVDGRDVEQRLLDDCEGVAQSIVGAERCQGSEQKQQQKRCSKRFCGCLPFFGDRVAVQALEAAWDKASGVQAQSLLRIETTWSTGMAKPMPILPPVSDTMKVLMPITSPLIFTSGPPLLPGLTAASVWIMLR
ncbi:MAG: hypothetical protein BWX83_01258 [Candidatus Cloacimonetes bacterium ADurb.Bin117]|nr:MAG: hypothetical protein BWX83_01258 [Candidatus Cloacimonetes bacterium ADurb.Bin117]